MCLLVSNNQEIILCFQEPPKRLILFLLQVFSNTKILETEQAEQIHKKWKWPNLISKENSVSTLSYIISAIVLYLKVFLS